MSWNIGTKMYTFDMPTLCIPLLRNIKLKVNILFIILNGKFISPAYMLI